MEYSLQDGYSGGHFYMCIYNVSLNPYKSHVNIYNLHLNHFAVCTSTELNSMQPRLVLEFIAILLSHRLKTPTFTEVQGS